MKLGIRVKNLREERGLRADDVFWVFWFFVIFNLKLFYFKQNYIKIINNVSLHATWMPCQLKMSTWRVQSQFC